MVFSEGGMFHNFSCNDPIVAIDPPPKSISVKHSLNRRTPATYAGQSRCRYSILYCADYNDDLIKSVNVCATDEIVFILLLLHDLSGLALILVSTVYDRP